MKRKGTFLSAIAISMVTASIVSAPLVTEAATAGQIDAFVFSVNGEQYEVSLADYALAFSLKQKSSLYNKLSNNGAKVPYVHAIKSTDQFISLGEYAKAFAKYKTPAEAIKNAQKMSESETSNFKKMDKNGDVADSSDLEVISIE